MAEIDCGLAILVAETPEHEGDLGRADARIDLDVELGETPDSVPATRERRPGRARLVF